MLLRSLQRRVKQSCWCKRPLWESNSWIRILILTHQLIATRQATFFLYLWLDPKVPKSQGKEFPRRSLQLRDTNPRPRLDDYNIMVRLYPAWLWIRKASLHLANREFKAGLTFLQSWTSLLYIKAKKCGRQMKLSNLTAFQRGNS
jgi:hypothetical protein